MRFKSTVLLIILAASCGARAQSDTTITTQTRMNAPASAAAPSHPCLPSSTFPRKNKEESAWESENLNRVLHDFHNEPQQPVSLAACKDAIVTSLTDEIGCPLTRSQRIGAARGLVCLYPENFATMVDDYAKALGADNRCPESKRLTDQQVAIALGLVAYGDRGIIQGRKGLNPIARALPEKRLRELQLASRLTASHCPKSGLKGSTFLKLIGAQKTVCTGPSFSQTPACKKAD